MPITYPEEVEKRFKKSEKAVTEIGYYSNDWVMPEKQPEIQLSKKQKVKDLVKRFVYAPRNYRADRLRFLNGKEALASIMPTAEEREEQENHKFEKNVKISIIVPLYNTAEKFLRDMIDSCIWQTYQNWELCLADGSDDKHPEVERICREYMEKDSRVVYSRLKSNEGISGNTNECIKMATGEFAALYDHDDMLHPSALYYAACAIEEQGADLIYTDEMTFDTKGLEYIETLHFKPDFAPQNLKGVNYITHLLIFDLKLLESNGLYDDNYDGSQDHDMILRLTAAAKKVVHIPKILYFWRIHPLSVASDISAKPYAITAGRRAVHDFEKRAGREAEVHSVTICATHYRLDYQLSSIPDVQVNIIYNGDETALATLLCSLERRSTSKNYHVAILDMTGNGIGNAASVASEFAANIISKNDGEKLSELLNRVVRESDIEYHYFLHESSVITTADWQKMLVQYEMQDEIGVTISRLMKSDMTLVENGYILGLGQDSIALPIYRGVHFNQGGYIGRNYYVHNISAASVYGMMLKKSVFDAVGGFDERLSDAHYIGIDFCIRVRATGREVVDEVFVVQLMNHLDKTDNEDEKYMGSKWKAVLEAGDPYYNPNLKKDGSFAYEV